MNCIAMIPARYASTRFPAKLMQMMGNKTVIRHTYDNTVKTGLFDRVIVVTDSHVIYDEIRMHGGDVMMSLKPMKAEPTGLQKPWKIWRQISS